MTSAQKRKLKGMKDVDIERIMKLNIIVKLPLPDVGKAHLNRELAQIYQAHDLNIVAESMTSKICKGGKRL